MERKYQLTFYGTYKNSSEPPVNEYDQKEANELFPEASYGIQILEVGEKYIDSDGDEWERTE